MIEYSVEHLCSFAGVGGEKPEVVGPTPEGLKINFHLSGGRVSGPKINGVVLPGGGDWMTVRRDGVGLVDARVSFETADSAVVMASYTGVIEFGADGYDRFLRVGTPQ